MDGKPFAEQFAAVFGCKPTLPTPGELEAAVRMLRTNHPENTP